MNSMNCLRQIILNHSGPCTKCSRFLKESCNQPIRRFNLLTITAGACPSFYWLWEDKKALIVEVPTVGKPVWFLIINCLREMILNDSGMCLRDSFGNAKSLARFSDVCAGI